jgi:hypothetical protein
MIIWPCLRHLYFKQDHLDLVPGGPFAEAGQLGDVRFFDPAPPVPVVQVAAGLIGVPLADFTLLIHRDLPDLDRDGRDRGLLPPRPKFTGGTPADLAAGERRSPVGRMPSARVASVLVGGHLACWAVTGTAGLSAGWARRRRRLPTSTRAVMAGRSSRAGESSRPVTRRNC